MYVIPAQSSALPYPTTGILHQGSEKRLRKTVHIKFNEHFFYDFPSKGRLLSSRQASGNSIQVVPQTLKNDIQPLAKRRRAEQIITTDDQPKSDLEHSKNDDVGSSIKKHLNVTERTQIIEELVKEIRETWMLQEEYFLRPDELVVQKQRWTGELLIHIHEYTRLATKAESFDVKYAHFQKALELLGFIHPEWCDEKSHLRRQELAKKLTPLSNLLMPEKIESMKKSDGSWPGALPSRDTKSRDCTSLI